MPHSTCLCSYLPPNHGRGTALYYYLPPNHGRGTCTFKEVYGIRADRLLGRSATVYVATRRATSARDARGSARLKHNAKSERSAMHCKTVPTRRRDEAATMRAAPNQHASTPRTNRHEAIVQSSDTTHMTQMHNIVPINEQARHRTRSKPKRWHKQKPTRRIAEARCSHAKSHNPTQEQQQAEHHRREDEHPAVRSTIKTPRLHCIVHRCTRPA